jgi:hypothetical protein
VPGEGKTVPAVELARATKLDGVVWEPGSAGVAEGGAVTAGRLRLQAGRLTLAFPGGVMLTVEGPADLDLQGRDRVSCHYGKLRVRVAPGGEGFTVGAPGYEIVDLGTEFGLNLDRSGKARMMVFEGEAVVSLLGTNGRTLHSALLEGDKAVEVDPNGVAIREVTAQPEAFVRLPEYPPPPLDLGPHYRSAVLDTKPWGYWRFQQMTDGRTPNEIVGRPALKALGGVQLGGHADGNRWAVFAEGDLAQALLLDGTWTPPRATGYAVELWVQPAPLGPNLPGQTALVSAIAWPEGETENHVSFLELTARSRRSPPEPCSVRFLDRWPAGVSGGVNVFSRRNVDPARWHHVVGQKADDRLELYIDGELAGTTPVATDPNGAAEVTGPCSLLVGRLKQRPLASKHMEIRPFEGRLDELAVYNRPLSPEEVRRHSALRTAGGPPTLTAPVK